MTGAGNVTGAEAEAEAEIRVIRESGGIGVGLRGDVET